MVHQTLKIQPGVRFNETPALNTAGISQCQLIRFKANDEGLGLPEKLGGWGRFYGSPTPNIVRQLLSWEDINAAQWLGLGMDNSVSGTTGLAVLACAQDPNSGLTTGSQFADITPTFESADSKPYFLTVEGSPIVTVEDDNSHDIKVGSSVYIAVQVAVGGLVLFGLYPIYASIDLNTFQIVALTPLGLPNPAITGGTATYVPELTTTAGSADVAVALNNHGYSVGDTFPILVSTTVGGIDFYGNYIVSVVVDENNFSFRSVFLPTVSDTEPLNLGNVRLVYSLVVDPPTTATGYGVGGYGDGGYGTGVVVPVQPGAITQSSDWSIDNWGDILLASPEGAMVDGVGVSGIYQWDPTGGNPVAVIIPQAPPVCDSFFVAMPQRQIVALGASFTGIPDPLLVRWCDIGNFNSWIATVTNQAGSYRLPRGSKIVGGLQGQQQGFIWTDLALWTMSYISQPYVYGFNEVGNGCGLISRKAAVSLNGIIYWMSQTQFFVYSAGGVQPIPCPVWDLVFQNLDTTNLHKIRVAANSRFNEIAWFYPSVGGNGENDSYVKFNTLLQVWDYGKLARSSWINQSVIGPPLGTDPNSLYVYQHEISPDADGKPLIASFTTGFFAIADADFKTFVDEIWPDMKWGYYGAQQSATVQLSFLARDFPTDTPTLYGPYSLTVNTTYISPRIRGRLLALSFLSADLGTFWRLGGLRYRGAPDGRY